MEYRKGTLIGFEAGQYSDFRFSGMLVTLAHIDLRALATEYVTERRALAAVGGLGEFDDPDDFTGFMGWLVAKQHCAPINYSTVYLGAYSEFDSEFAIPPADDDDE